MQVSATCRLGFEDEYKLLTSLLPNRFPNRQRYLQALLSKETAMPYLVPEGPILEDAFDKFVDKSCITAEKDSWMDKLSKISYKRPADVHVCLCAVCEMRCLQVVGFRTLCAAEP
jgi:hypothetical protein